MRINKDLRDVNFDRKCVPNTRRNAVENQEFLKEKSSIFFQKQFKSNFCSLRSQYFEFLNMRILNRNFSHSNKVPSLRASPDLWKHFNESSRYLPENLVSEKFRENALTNAEMRDTIWVMQPRTPNRSSKSLAFPWYMLNFGFRKYSKYTSLKAKSALSIVISFLNSKW